LTFYIYINTGINRSLNNGEINKEIMLQLSNVPKAVPICKISDVDFSEVCMTTAVIRFCAAISPVSRDIGAKISNSF